jgi:hypothetical protein
MARKKSTKTKKKKTVKKKSTPKKKEDDSVTYVRVDGPIPTRKDILETAIDSAEILRDWESYKKHRATKLETYEKLVGVMRKIDREVNSLRRHLPKMKEVEDLEKPVIKKEKKVEPTKVEKKKFNSELDREIADIRGKLNNLRI